jgi:Protein of unknown function (DUF3592)
MNVGLPALFSLIFVIIGWLLVRFALKMTAKAQQTRLWPSTEGEIAHSATLYESSRSPSGGVSATYKADIAYRYQVNGKDFSSSTITLLDMSSTASRAQSIVGRYPDKSKVQVFYNPDDPSDAVLEPGASTGLVCLYLVSGMFSIGGLFFLVMSLTGHVKMAASVASGSMY